MKTFLAVACVVAVWLASIDAFVGVVFADAALVLGVASIMFLIGRWVIRKLRAPGANPVELWAKRRGLVYTRADQLPEATPLLCRGDSRKAIDVVSGELAPGMNAVLARYTYVIGHEDERRPYRYSVVVTRVPESVAFAPLLLCRHKPTARTGDDGFEETYAARRSVALESVDLRRGYEIETWSDQDPVWIRELFSPMFIVWLADSAPEGLSFEVTDGMLCASLPGHEHEPADFEALAMATAHIAQRLREESLEEEGRPDAAAAPPGGGAAAARLQAGVDQVRWSQPPADAGAASRPYRRVAAREPGLWLLSLLGGAAVAGAVSIEALAEGRATPGDLAASAVIGIVALFGLAAGLIWGRARRYGQEAFIREYARSRGLELRSGRRFQGDHMRVALPGVAEHAMRGWLRDAGAQAELVLAADRTNRGSPVHYAVLVTRVPPVNEVPWLRLQPAASAGSAAGRTGGMLPTVGGASRRLDRLEERLQRRHAVTAAASCDELAAESLFPADVTAALIADGAAAYSLTLHGPNLTLFREAPSPDARSAAELDRFWTEAGRIAIRVEHAVAQRARAGNTTSSGHGVQM